MLLRWMVRQTRTPGIELNLLWTCNNGLTITSNNVDVMAHKPCGVWGVGFNINLTPGFSPTRLAFMLGYGGVLAVANLRFPLSAHCLLAKIGAQEITLYCHPNGPVGTQVCHLLSVICTMCLRQPCSISNFISHPYVMLRGAALLSGLGHNPTSCNTTPTLSLFAC